MENKHIYQEWLSLSQMQHTGVTKTCFIEVEKQYTQANRQYHNLVHILDLFGQIKEAQLSDKDKIVLAHVALFHDVIYVSTATDNELKSAQFAAKWLDEFGTSHTERQIINDIIITTATHISKDTLTQLFLDMDMSILGSSSEKYVAYYKAIRREYKKIPYLLYRRGRKRFLKETLERTHIFQTKAYQKRFEEKARINVLKEISLL